MIVKRILLTGASGYLGQHLLFHWMQGDGLQPSSQEIPDSRDNDDDLNDDDNDFHYEITALYHRMEGFSESVARKLEQQRQEQNRPPVNIGVNEILRGKHRSSNRIGTNEIRND